MFVDIFTKRFLFFLFISFSNARSTFQVGLSQARRLAQGKTIKIHASSAFPVQIDGEPFIHQPGCLEITHDEQVLYSLSLIHHLMLTQEAWLMAPCFSISYLIS